MPYDFDAKVTEEVARFRKRVEDLLRPCIRPEDLEGIVDQLVYHAKDFAGSYHFAADRKRVVDKKAEDA